jgi:hypothetical protein
VKNNLKKRRKARMDVDEEARLRKEKMSQLKRRFENDTFRDELVRKNLSLGPQYSPFR